MTTVLVTGGREYANQARVDHALDMVHEVWGITRLVHGAARGTDRLAHDWARRRGVMPDPYPADWDNIDHPQAVIRFNKRGKPYDVTAGKRRNIRMLIETCPALVISFPGGDGTAHCVAQALRRDIPWLEVDDMLMEAVAAADDPKIPILESLKS